MFGQAVGVCVDLLAGVVCQWHAISDEHMLCS